ncbi:thermonuclease family protein [Wenxinia marina]|uniref:TNase-like domain-containing protein n=1 Tax=Wenxinia marina DSM 24838 TaxID=1123501 RepID=A0A0D0QJ89_9RHOB|nr:hypothetical protein [Wenxinia marina]KIQ71103.1 hypothetical protein Wenmar_00482 [Wenxinia marina DSM 24838]GGL54811.1 hypothetical protein GCM10011392_06530 [Wenxinia marina]
MGQVVRFRRTRRRRSRLLPGRVLLLPLAALALWLALPPDPLPASDRPSIPDGGGAWTPVGARGGDLSARVTHIRDADTIEVGGVPVRIANLDCAEAGTAEGDRATDRVRQLLVRSAVSCDLEGRRSYDREVGTCRMADGRDLGEVLIAEGYCARWRWN